jgi:hypothetical protein
MRNRYKVGPFYRAGLIVCGGMCAGLGIAVLVASAIYRVVFTHGVTTNAPTPPASDLEFLLCGLALLVGGTLALDSAAGRIACSQRYGQPFRR